MSSDAANFGCPPCPNSMRHTRMPDEEGCPRSDTYRAIESGTAHGIFGWLFRCRTCGTMFFRASREASVDGFRAAQVDRAVKAEQRRGERR